MGQLGKYTDDVAVELCQVLRTEESWSVRRDAAQLLGEFDQVDIMVVNNLWQSLLDVDNDVRKACARSLAQLGKQNTMLTSRIESLLIQAIESSEFEKIDSFERRPAYDYAYEGLRLLIIGGEMEEK